MIALYRSDYYSTSKTYTPTLVATYTYDPWGAPTGIYDANGSTISQTAYHVAAYNPFRYRGYRYDGDTRLYYLQSRYYDPTVGRFINADDTDYLGANKISLSYNLFTYCENEPILKIDCEGYAPVYRGLVGFGFQAVFTANVLCYQGFVGIEAVWFPKCNNNFRNGIIPWVYWYYGGSIGTTFNLQKLLSPTLLTNPKNVIKGFGLSFSCSLSVTFFVVTAKGQGISKADDYNGAFYFRTCTVWGVTVSKAWGDKITTYGVGFSWEIGIKKWSISLGKKLFGSTSGRSNYIRIHFGKPSQSLYNCVKGRV